MKNGTLFIAYHLILYFSFSCFSQIAFAQSCSNYLIDWNREKAAALYVANSGDYDVRVLSGIIEGHPKTVVILGETHVKNEIEKQRGKEVVRYFAFRGLEGADLSKYWAGYGMNIILKLMYNHFRKMGEKNSSTILLANDEAYYARMGEFETLIEDDEDSDLITVEDENIGHYLESLDDGVPFKEETLPSRAMTTTHLKIVELEKGHQPSLSEQVSIARYPFLLLGCLGFVCSAVSEVVVPGNNVSEVLNWIVLPPMLLNYFHHKGAKFFKRWRYNKVYDFIFAIEYGLLDGRNKTMVKNIVKALKENTNPSSMLVIVGKLHNDGMERLLIQNYGFEKRTIEDLVSTPF